MSNDFQSLSDTTLQLLVRLAITIGIGFLIGLEREFSKQIKEKEEQFAGIRTHTLVAMFGFAAALLSSEFDAWILAAAFAGLMALVVVSYLRISKNEHQLGGTSEITLMLTFILGTLVFLNYILLALVITVIMLLLLTYKPSLHLFVKNLTQQEVRAFVQFVIISALVIPFLPDNDFGPYQAWNLKDIWKMVILVSGISLVGYLLSKWLGGKGIILAGIVGGLASSTAVALSFSRRSKESEGSSAVFAIGIIAASSIMFPRVLFEVVAVNRELAKYIWIQLSILAIVGLLAAYFIHRFNKDKKHSAEIELANPLNFSVALKFALLYAAIVLLVKFADDRFGESGIYAASIISGITDVDAITLSMARMAKGGNYPLAANAILLATLSNTLMKFIYVFALGSSSVRKFAYTTFGAVILTGLIIFAVQLGMNGGQG